MANEKKEEKTTMDKAYALVDKMTTAEQLKLQGFIGKILQDKANAAADELDLINGSQKSTQ